MQCIMILSSRISVAILWSNDFSLLGLHDDCFGSLVSSFLQGRADFSEMDILDGDQVPLVSRHGQRCARDIVQFVPFRDFERVSRLLM